jgi:ribose/xylose/arabinose/galactoside ABC-type transport system permease subunit
VASGAALLALWVAARPADASHPYGHTKAEYLSAVVEGVLIVLAALTGFVLRWTKFGRHVFAIGGNEHAATLTGVPVRPIKVAVYMISAVSAGIAGIIQTGWLGAVTTNIGSGMELQVIAAAVIALWIKIRQRQSMVSSSE